MEYYAKSPVPVLKEENRRCLLKQLGEVLAVFDSRSDQDSYNLLRRYQEKLITEQIVIEQKSRTPRRPALIDELSKL